MAPFTDPTLPSEVVVHTHPFRGGVVLPHNYPSRWAGATTTSGPGTQDLTGLPANGTGIVVDPDSVCIYNGNGTFKKLPRAGNGCTYP
jgi:hypothetical protein